MKLRRRKNCSKQRVSVFWTALYSHPAHIAT